MNKFKGMHIEFHILQSFPVSCLNRDDVGAPKSAMIGGAVRARVSSQCWKRHVRLALRELGVKIGVRTKQLAETIAAACEEKGATKEQAAAFGEACAARLTSDTLYFFSGTEADAIAAFGAEHGFDPASASTTKSGKTILAPELLKTHKEHFKPAVDGLDIALFGRMVAQEPELNVTAAASFAHAISTHRADSEVEFFTALDDLRADGETGSAHMGSLEYNSATYYRYVSLDLGQLCCSLGGEGMTDALSAFVKALYLAVPSARQTTQTALRPWDYARIYVRKGQGMQASFDEPVKAKGEGFLKPSMTALDDKLDKQEKLSGSLFGKIASFTYGGENGLGVDQLVDGLVECVRKIEGQA